MFTNRCVMSVWMATLLAGAGCSVPAVAAEPPPRPATVAAARAVIDLETFPRIKGAEPQAISPSTVLYPVAATLDEVLAFYRGKLTGDGWKEVAPAAPTPGTLLLSKKGFRLAVSAYDAGGGQTQVSITNLGNYPVAALPKPPKSEVTYEGFHFAMFTSPENVTALETFAYKEFTSRGWKVYWPLDRGGQEEADVRNLSFLQEGMEAQVWIRRSPQAPETFSVQYSVSLLPDSVPVPGDVSWVEFAPISLGVVYETGLDRAACLKFLDEQMPQHGWKRLDSAAREVPAYVRDKRIIVFHLDEIEGGLRVHAGERLENRSWLFEAARPLQPEEDAPPAKDDRPGLQAADVPLRDDAFEVRRDRDQQKISFHTKQPVAANVEFYTAYLKKQKWQPDDRPLLSDDFALVRFKQGEQELTLRSSKFSDDGEFTVMLDGDGLLWTRPLPTDNDVISYLTWLRREGKPPGLRELPAFEKAMQTRATPDPK